MINGKSYDVYVDPIDKDLRHETFVLKRKGISDSCKTARKPYDLVVFGCLILAKYHFYDDIKVSSDGGQMDWEPAIEWVKQYIPEAILPVFLRDGIFN